MSSPLTLPSVAKQLRLTPPLQLVFTAKADVNMSVCNDVADYRWLTSDEAAALLDDLATSDLPLHTAVTRLRRCLSPERTHLVAELVDLRRRAAMKFAAAARMFFTRTMLEQATDEHVADYKAARVTRHAGCASARSVTTIADLCCGIGGDLLAFTQRAGSSPTPSSIVALDCNPIATHFAAANVRAAIPAADVRFQTSDAAAIELDNIAAWHIDPDRRAAGRRTTSLESCQPSIAVIEKLLRRAPHAAIKLAPASKVPTDWTERCELEWISRGGECRQLVAWHGGLAEFPGQHRATILSVDRGLARGGVPDSPARTISGTPNQSTPIANKLHDYVIDVDPAVLAAKLKGALAAAHHLSALDHGPTYLTGDLPISDPALTCFRVDDVSPLRTQSLARHFRSRGIGQLEIKKRGVDIVPEKLRRELKLRGDNVVTLIVARVAGRPTAILAHRIAC